MWLSKDLISLFQVSKDTVDALREELSAARAELQTLRAQSATDRANLDWMRAKVNQLEFERTALLEKAHGIRVPAPQLVRQTPSFDPEAFGTGMEDIGELAAKALGLPAHDIFKHQEDSH